jgi:hypothetical protein
MAVSTFERQRPTPPATGSDRLEFASVYRENFEAMMAFSGGAAGTRTRSPT